MSRAAPATEVELRATFNSLITNADGRTDVPSDTGLDDQTVAAIERAWSAGSKVSDALIASARQELEMQLDGTHAREAQSAQDAVAAQVFAEHQTQPITPASG
jgi:hypothetical protein